MTRIALSFLLFSLTLGFAQAMENTSSSELELTREVIPLDTNAVNELLEKSGAYFFSKPDSCLYFAQQALTLARKLSFTKGEIVVLNVCGEAYRFLGDYPNSLDCQFQALELSRRGKRKQFEAASLTFIGFNYSELGEYRPALAYQFSAKAIYEQFPNDERSAFNLSNIGNTYIGLRLLDSAFFYLEKAWVLAQAVNHPNLMVLTQRRLINVKLASGKYTEALSIYRSAIEHARKAGDKVNPGALNLLAAELYLKLDKQDSALYYARLALAYARKSSQRQQILESAGRIANILRERSSPDSVIYYQDIAMAMKDSLFSANKFKQLQVLALREQQRKSDLLHEQDEFRNQSRLIGLAGILLFVLVIAVILYRNYRQKLRVNFLLETQKSDLEATLLDLKTTQTQLIQSEKMASLGELTAGIAHEIQNPLNFVNNFSEVNKELLSEMKEEIEKGNLESAKSLANNAIDNQEKINHHGKRADAIVKGMLQHSRNSSGIKELTDINALVDEYIRLAYHGFRAKDKSFNLELKNELEQSAGIISIIPQEIGRVVLNLVNNAFYAVDEKKKQNGTEYLPMVSISTKRSGNYLLITVKDNGNGIPQKILDKIFQPFFTTKPVGQGTGLGLSLSYDIVKAHGGELTVHTSEGEGSEFTISLP